MKSHHGRSIAAFAVVLMSAAPSLGATLTALSSFGGGDGWRAPGEVVAGDTPGTNTAGVYNYLGTASLERGLAFNASSGNLILVSRSTAGNGIRVLNGVTGADAGFLNQGSGVITGGTFTTSTVGVADDGAIYVANLQTNAGTGAFKVYQWINEAAAAPTTYFGATIAGFAGTPRLGDSLDVVGTGAGTTIVAGASGSTGYAVINSGGGNAVASFVPAGPGAGDFRLGVTFAGSADNVWGKQTGGTPAAAPLRLTSYLGAAGTGLGSATLTSGGEMAMDYAVIGGVPVLAVVDANSSVLRVYDVTLPSVPVLLISGTTTSPGLAANGNAVGSVKFGSIGATSATIYAMSTNQGIQAFRLEGVGVPEPAGLALLGMAWASLVWVRRRS